MYREWPHRHHVALPSAVPRHHNSKAGVLLVRGSSIIVLDEAQYFRIGQVFLRPIVLGPLSRACHTFRAALGTESGSQGTGFPVTATCWSSCSSARPRPDDERGRPRA